MTSGYRVRLIIAWLLFLVVIATGFRWEWIPYLRHAGNPPREPGEIVGISRRPLRERTDPLPPDLGAALAEADRRLRFGETVGVAFGPPLQAYSYAFYRTVYELAPRRVLTPLGPDNGSYRRNLRRANYVVTWQLDPQLGGGFEPIFVQGDAKLLRRSQ